MINQSLFVNTNLTATHSLLFVQLIVWPLKIQLVKPKGPVEHTENTQTKTGLKQGNLQAKM